MALPLSTTLELDARATIWYNNVMATMAPPVRYSMVDARANPLGIYVGAIGNIPLEEIVEQLLQWADSKDLPVSNGLVDSQPVRIITIPDRVQLVLTNKQLLVAEYEHDEGTNKKDTGMSASLEEHEEPDDGEDPNPADAWLEAVRNFDPIEQEFLFRQLKGTMTRLNRIEIYEPMIAFLRKQ